MVVVHFDPIRYMYTTLQQLKLCPSWIRPISSSLDMANYQIWFRLLSFKRIQFENASGYKLFGIVLSSRLVLVQSLEENVLEIKPNNVDKVSSRGGLEVECPLPIQLKAGHYCFGGSNTAWGIFTDEFIWLLFPPAIIVVLLYSTQNPYN